MFWKGSNNVLELRTQAQAVRSWAVAYRVHGAIFGLNPKPVKLLQ
jgi:hypothetical protein